MTYEVVAPLVIAKDRDGRNHHVYEGGRIAWLSDEQAEHLLGTGLVVELGPRHAVPEVDEEPGDAAGDPGPDDAGGAPAPGDERPATVATKDVLVDWLLNHGTYDRAELEAQTKDELWALIDATD